MRGHDFLVAKEVKLFDAFFILLTDTMDDGKSDADTSVDSTLDTKTYPEDFVSRMFNSIDWEARKKTPRSNTEWISIETLRNESLSYTEKYLNYKVEEGQVDLSNPFHIEESNKIRGRLEKKNKKVVFCLNLFYNLEIMIIHCRGRKKLLS